MARHDGQKRTIARIMRRHHIAVEEEVRVPEWDRPNPRRNSDTDEWLRARLDLAFPEGTYADVRVTHPTAQSHLHDAAKNDGAAAVREGEKEKRARYGRGAINHRRRGSREVGADGAEVVAPDGEERRRHGP